MEKGGSGTLSENMSCRKIIYYAIDVNPTYLLMAKNSVRTLRTHNRNIPIRVFVYGKITKTDRIDFECQGAQVTVRPLPRDLPKTFLKWLPLGELKEQRIIYLDADTFIFADVEELFTRFRKRLFYARREAGTGSSSEKLGKETIQPQLLPSELKRVRRTLGSSTVPVFNSGVMIFNRGFGKRMGRKVGFLVSLEERFRNGELRYPCVNSYILEEIAASLTLGKIRGFTWGLIDRETSPWGLEMIGGIVKDPGIVLHTWHVDYGFGQALARLSR